MMHIKIQILKKLFFISYLSLFTDILNDLKLKKLSIFHFF